MRSTSFLASPVVVGLLALASVGAQTRAAHAAPAAPARKGARITWVRGIEAERCVGRAGLEEDVKSRLGYDPFALPADLAIEGTVVRAPPSGFRAELVVRDASDKVLGTRQLASREADCRSLGEAVAVAITVAIDPDAPGTKAAPAEDEPFTTVREAAPPPPPPAPAPARDEERAHAMLAMGVGAGLLPDLSPVAALRVRALAGARLELGVGAHFWPESRTGGIGLAMAGGSLEACAVPFLGARVFRWCAALHAGVFQVFVHAPELAPVEVGMFPWLGAETGPALSIPLAGRVRLELMASVVVPITRRQAFVRGQAEPLWEQTVLGGRADVGLGATF